jgi:hypothetical protein
MPMKVKAIKSELRRLQQWVEKRRFKLEFCCECSDRLKSEFLQEIKKARKNHVYSFSKTTDFYLGELKGQGIQIRKHIRKLNEAKSSLETLKKEGDKLLKSKKGLNLVISKVKLGRVSRNIKSYVGKINTLTMQGEKYAGYIKTFDGWVRGYAPK